MQAAPIPTIWKEIKRYRWSLVLGTFMLAIFQLALNRIEWLSKGALDQIFKDHRPAWKPALVILFLAVVAFVARLCSRWFWFYTGRDVEYDLRKQLLARLHQLGSSFYRSVPPGDIMSRATNDLAQVRLFVGFGLMNLFNLLLALVSVLQVMLGLSWRLTVVSFVTLPLLLAISRIFSKRLFAANRKTQEAIGSLSSLVQQNLSGVRVIRSFALEEAEQARFAGVNRRYLDASLQLARLRGSMMPIAGATAALGLLIFFAYGSSLLLRGPTAGGISEGAFFAFSLSLGRMTWPIIALGFVIPMWQRGRASYQRIQEILTAQPDIVESPTATKQLPGAKQEAEARLGARLAVRNLHFSYGVHAVLQGVSLEVPAGQSLAIVGKTGSGKSTLAQLLVRLLPTPPGAVFVQGHDVCEWTLSALRKTVGYAQQDAFLFSTTVARNIGFSLEHPDSAESMARIRQAAADACIREEIEQLPDQFDTIVGERGVQLSGGQKQRISLARALLWQPPLLILDDPISAVDAKTEAAILDTLQQRAQQCTLVLVTHRVAAARRCDRIVVLDQGQVVQQGTHADLIAQPGIYAAFAEEQRVTEELEAWGERT